jgi:hypothetical protein
MMLQVSVPWTRRLAGELTSYWGNALAYGHSCGRCGKDVVYLFMLNLQQADDGDPVTDAELQ